MRVNSKLSISFSFTLFWSLVNEGLRLLRPKNIKKYFQIARVSIHTLKFQKSFDPFCQRAMKNNANANMAKLPHYIALFIFSHKKTSANAGL
jgi:hypothetical protein